MSRDKDERGEAVVPRAPLTKEHIHELVNLALAHRPAADPPDIFIMAVAGPGFVKAPWKAVNTVNAVEGNPLVVVSAAHAVLRAYLTRIGMDREPELKRALDILETWVNMERNLRMRQ